MRAFFTACCCLFFLSGHAQLGFQFSYIKPSSIYGYIFRPGLCPELQYRASEVDDRFKVAVSIGYYSLKTRQDQFPIYGLTSDGLTGQTTISAGYEKYDSYKVMPVGLNFDFKLLDKPVSPTIGLDLYYYSIKYHHITSVRGLAESEENMSIGAFAFVPKVGAVIELDELVNIGTGISKSFGVEPETEVYQSYWKPYVNVTYYFD